MKDKKVITITNNHNNTYHSTIKMELPNTKRRIHITFSKEINDKGPKFKFGHIVKISKNEIIFAKCYVPNFSEDVFS